MTAAKIATYLESFINYELFLEKLSPTEFKLDRVTELLRRIGWTKKVPIVHIAGSKGKGSTCAIAATILKEAGYCVGLYTSPHLENMRERIRILEAASVEKSSEGIFRDQIHEKELESIVEEIKPTVEEMRSTEEWGRLTFFEMYTALALYYFEKRHVDVIVLETGLGGRLDATNAVASDICAITPISFDHMNILGNSLQEIAAEKAAIIKDRRQKVVIAPQEIEAMNVLQNRCREFGIAPIQIQNEPQSKLLNSLSLRGRHQKTNAAVAISIVDCLRAEGFEINEQAIARGLSNVEWPGRFETVQRDPLTILDGAHNVASAKVLSETIREFSPEKKVILILGCSADKDKEGICRELNRITDRVITTRANHSRAAEFSEDELRIFFPGKSFLRTTTVEDALEAAYENHQSDHLILVTGSLFVVGQARKAIKECINLKI